MTRWIIEPLDPLIVRDGRPFDPTPGARARSVPFPYPSTTTGGIRTRAGKDDNGALAGFQRVGAQFFELLGAFAPGLGKRSDVILRRRLHNTGDSILLTRRLREPLRERHQPSRVEMMPREQLLERSGQPLELHSERSAHGRAA